MSTQDELCFTSASRLAELIRQREVSPVDVADAVIARVEAVDPDLIAYCAFDPAKVRAAAEAAERALDGDGYIGPLHGVPVSVKDLIFTRDLPTVGGSKAYVGFVPDEDDVVVERIKRAGAVLLGKTNVPDFGFGPTFDPVHGTTRNPWDPTRTPAGSSGGSAAAVAAGLGPVSLASDGGGSIRVPASFCGVFGLNPSYGRVPMYPGTRDTRFPGFSGWESLERIGPITRTVTDAALLLDVIAGPDPRDRHSLPDDGTRYLDHLAEHADPDLTGLRIGLTLDWGGYARVDAEVADLVERAAELLGELGAAVELATPAMADPAAAFETITALDADPDAMRELLGRYPAGTAPPRLVSLVEKERSFADAGRAVAARKDVYNAFWRFFRDYDLLVTPTAPVVAFPLDLTGPAEIGGRPVESAMPLAQYTAPVSLAGNPAASVPCGWTAGGLPVGLHMVGNHLDDRLVLRTSRALEIALPWADRRPPLLAPRD